MSKLKVGLISMQFYDNRPKDSVGSSRIRGDWICKYWDECELYSTGKSYDVLIFQKSYWQDMVKRFKGIKIFDICDPDWLDHRPVVEIIRNCDGVVTSSEALAKQIRKFDIGGKPVLCIPDRVDLEWSKPVHGEHKGTAKSCVYFGYSNNANVVLDATVDPLRNMGIELTVISDQPYHSADHFVKYDADTVNEELVKHDFILLPNAPSSNYRFKFKSNNKTVQAWALGMPVVHDGEDLKRFMKGEEREMERVLRLKEVKEKWDVRMSVVEWKLFIKELIEIRGKNRKIG